MNSNRTPPAPSDNGRVFVIGGSAGSIEAVRELLNLLPRNFPSPILIVIHTPPDSPGTLPYVVGRNGNLIVQHATDGAAPRGGHVYIAPPGFHLQLEPGRMRLIGGPTENRHRPAIDPLFRSAAIAYGPAAVGIVLSGYLDDGTAGLFRIKQSGGIAIVQDPEDAIVGDMPRHAAERVDPDYSLPIQELAPLMVELAQPSEGTTRVAAMEEPPRPKRSKEEDPGTPSVFTCPECHGTLWEVEEGGTLRFRCRVGHAFTADTMLEDQNADVERALWAALRTLEENTELSQRLAERSQSKGFSRSAERYRSRAEEAYRNAKVLRELLTGDRQVPQPARSLDEVRDELTAD